MRGKHLITVESGNLRYVFTIRRNFTVIQGDSATGKTTLAEMISHYGRGGRRSGITINSDVTCEAYSGGDDRWRYELEGMAGSIVFFDEEYNFLYTPEFSEYAASADNYFVFITRRPLKNLPYSVNEIYGIRSSGKYRFPEQVYHEFYPIYSDVRKINPTKTNWMLLVEDKESEYQFFDHIARKATVVSAEGNANIYPKMIENGENDSLLVIADGASFGAYVDLVVKYAALKGSIGLYFPESFEWMVLRSGIFEDNGIDDVLSHPEDYIDSQKYVSWERFFTSLLRERTQEAAFMRYSKSELADYCANGRNAERILRVMPKEIRELI